MDSSNLSTKELVRNRRASHDYELLDHFEAGIMLQGSEIKSLRQGGGSLQEAYVKVIKGAAWLLGCSIAPYRFSTIEPHEERRDRKLLLHKREIAKLHKAVQEKGLSIVAVSLYLKAGRAKIRIAIGRGKKLVDKRDSIKEKEQKRQIDRQMKSR